MIKNKKVSYTILICILGLGLLLFLSGCNSVIENNTTENEYYTLYTVKEGNFHFSFEYPDTVSPGVSDFATWGSHHYISFTGTQNDTTVDSVIYRDWPQIYISIWEQSEMVKSAEASVEEKVESNIDNPNWHMISRYKTTVDGFDTFVLQYSYSGQFELYYRYYYADDICYSAYFEYNKRIWNIWLSYPSEMAIAAEADFNHILRTFKILD